MSETLRLADALGIVSVGGPLTVTMHEAAAELRRLHAELERKSDAIQRLWKERDELRSECRTLVRQNGEWQELHAELVKALRIVVDSDDRAAKQQARAALAKVEASK
jgi:chromosome segregation ATPase